MKKNFMNSKNKRFAFLVLSLFFVVFFSFAYIVPVARADVVVEDNKYYYTGSNFYVPLTYGDTVNMVNFECDLYPYERDIIIGDESLRRNLVLPLFSAFSDVKSLPYAVEYDGETHLPSNDGSLGISRYDRYVNYDSNNLPVDVTSLSQLTDNTYAEKVVYLVDNQSGGGATPLSVSDELQTLSSDKVIKAGHYTFNSDIIYPVSNNELKQLINFKFRVDASSSSRTYNEIIFGDTSYGGIMYSYNDGVWNSSIVYRNSSGWVSDYYRIVDVLEDTLVSEDFYTLFTANTNYDEVNAPTYTIPKGYYIVKDNPTLPPERLDIIFQLQSGQAIESIYTGNNDSLAYKPYNNDSYLVYNPATGWTDSNKRIWILANDIILNESAYQWFIENVSLYQPVERNTIKFATQLGFNSNVVSVQFTHDIGLSFDSATVIENKVIYTDANGFKYIITFYSDFDSSTVNLLNRYAFENRTYYIGNALNGDGNYQLGYDEGYQLGYEKGLYLGSDFNEQDRQREIQQAYDRGYASGENFGYNKGWQEAQDNEFTAGNFFSKTLDIFEVDIFGPISIADIFIIVIGLTLVVIVLKIFAGG